jgi:hypothetical protein
MNCTHVRLLKYADQCLVTENRGPIEEYQTLAHRQAALPGALLGLEQSQYHTLSRPSTPHTEATIIEEPGPEAIDLKYTN